ncbi:helix-turn-helix transcriptional regulator [Streptomyces cellulosae]|uniref:helix-turn-helix transcriptional regulator n=1 Tax=Streptomyces cellulosae TaxID=1968 RepID=UPI000D144FBC|nr:response regulator transcription factor [Streptomyces cellulosae]
MTRARVQVAIHAADPVSRAGVVHYLSPHTAIELVDSDAPGPDTVTVLIADALDDITLAQLRKLVRGKGARVVLVVHQIREPELMEVIASGVGVVVWRHEVTAPRLFQAVLAASRGDSDLPTDLLGRLMARVSSLTRAAQGDAALPAGGLSARETDVLRLVADGLDTKEIAAELSYSERTIKNIMHGLTTRLHLRNRAHAVAYAMREGYI